MDLGIPDVEGAEEIGSGGSAVVYRAAQPHLGRDVAVKVLSVRLSENSETERRRFAREQLALGRLSDLPGVVPVYSSGLTPDNRPYLVMPFYQNGSLQDRLDAEGSIPHAEAVDLMAQVSLAVDRAHADGIFHRDIKPANIMISRNGSPLIGDFGIARLVDSTTLFHSRAIATTPAYSAPEVFTGAHPSVAGDVYSIGATLFALITGAPAFLSASGDGNVLALMRRIEAEPVPDLRQQGVPDEIASIIEWAMAKDPADRPASAAEMAEGLRHAIISDVSDIAIDGGPTEPGSTPNGEAAEAAVEERQAEEAAEVERLAVEERQAEEAAEAAVEQRQAEEASINPANQGRRGESGQTSSAKPHSPNQPPPPTTQAQPGTTHPSSQATQPAEPTSKEPDSQVSRPPPFKKTVRGISIAFFLSALAILAVVLIWPFGGATLGSLANPYDPGTEVRIEYPDGDEVQPWTLQLLPEEWDGAEGEARLALQIVNDEVQGQGQLADLVLTLVDAEGDVLAPTPSTCRAGNSLDLTRTVWADQSVSGLVCWWVGGAVPENALLAVGSIKAEGRDYISLP